MTTPLVYIDIYQTPKPRLARRRPQTWRWRARNAHNNQTLATSNDAYTNKADCLDTITQLFSPGTDIYLRDGGLPTLLRQAQEPTT